MVTEVLLRLPVKSLLRFRAVCRSMAADAASASAAPPKLLLVAPTAGYDATVLCSCSPATRGSGPSAIPLFTLDDLRGHFVDGIAAQCRGLTLLYDAVAPAYHVVNAATRAATRLPPCPDVMYSSAGLGFDARANEYKVTRLFMKPDEEDASCEVYTLGGGARGGGYRWRPAIGAVPPSLSAASELAVLTAATNNLPPVLANGALHWQLDHKSVQKIIVATSNHDVHAYHVVSRNWETILPIADTDISYRSNRTAIRVSLYKETLAPVHKTREEISISSPQANATKEILLRLSVTEKKTKIVLVGKGTGGSSFSFAPLEKWLPEAANEDTWLDTKVVCSKQCHGLNLLSTAKMDYLYNPCSGLVPPLPVNDMPPAYVAGMLYWMSDPALGPCSEHAIVSFDIANGAFDVIRLPSHIAMWSSHCARRLFVVELEEKLCLVIADLVTNELVVWKLENGEWNRAYTICLKVSPDYSLISNIVVPLAVDSKDGRVLLSTGSRVGFYDPVKLTIDKLYATEKRRKKMNGARLDWSFAPCDKSAIPLVPMLYEESLVSYPRIRKRRYMR
ncbi:hypothetical protein EJB05_20772, partial [Eragrostis curvula]